MSEDEHANGIIVMVFQRGHSPFITEVYGKFCTWQLCGIEEAWSLEKAGNMLPDSLNRAELPGDWEIIEARFKPRIELIDDTCLEYDVELVEVIEVLTSEDSESGRGQFNLPGVW